MRPMAIALRFAAVANAADGRSCPNSSQCLRRLAEASQERAAHTVGIAETGGLGDALERVVAGFDSCGGGFETQALHRIGGRRPGLGREGASKVARAHRGALGKTLHGERLGEMAAHPADQLDEAPGPSAKLDEGRELRLDAWPALVNDKLLRDAPADIRAEIVLDQGDRQVDAR